MNTKPHTISLSPSSLVSLAVFPTDTSSTQLKLNDSHFTGNSQAEIKFDSSRHITGTRLSFSRYRKAVIPIPIVFCSDNQDAYGSLKENMGAFGKLCVKSKVKLFT
jgi:hypothetical protein